MLLSEKIAVQIEKEIQAESYKVLPSHYVLSKKYGVSPGTILRALNILKDRGVVYGSQGKKTVVANWSGEQDCMPGSVVESFVEFMKSRIESGFYRSGQELPKFLYFVVTNRMSPNTVSAAFGRLHSEALIHKRGKKWVVGPRHATTDSSQVLLPYGSRTVLILMRNYKSWQNDTHHNERVLPFILEFIKELQRYGFNFIFAQHDDQQGANDIFPTGRGEIEKKVHSLKKEYAGALTLGHSRGFPEAGRYASWMAEFGKPVFWYNPSSDSNDGSPSRQRSGYYYSSPVHADLADLAAQSLFDKGHRRVLYAIPEGQAHLPWTEERFCLIKEAAMKLGDGMRVKKVILRDSIWKEQTEMSEDILAHVISSAKKDLAADASAGGTVSSIAGKLRARMCSLSPALGHAVVQDNITALIAPNQYSAVSYYYWLRNAGISIPADLSMLTFDNRFYFQCFPISTIDWKFDEAGYRAAHVISGILPVNIDKHRVMIQKAGFVDRNSIGAPRVHALNFR